MKKTDNSPNTSSRERASLRLPPDVLEAIDAECSRRAGNISRNTWIAEAVAERLERLKKDRGN